MRSSDGFLLQSINQIQLRTRLFNNLLENTNGSCEKKLFVNQHASADAFIVELLVDSREDKGVCVIRSLASVFKRELAEFLQLRLAQRSD